MNRSSRSVAILGGQEKWYSSLINNLGYELVHDDGRSHKRIVERLKRSKMLVIYVDCVSHEATLDCRKISKRYRVPVHMFAGSRMKMKELVL